MMPDSDALDRFLARDHERVSAPGKTIVLSHGGVRPRAIVLLHGFTASPTQFIRFARDLFARGHNVLVPRLPRHGYGERMTDALAGLTDEHLRWVARESLEIGRTLGEQVTIAGFSAGGTLALWLAQRESFDRAVAIAPFLGVPWMPNSLMRITTNALLRVPNWFIWWDPVRRERLMPAHGYPRYPTHAIAYLYRISNDVMRDAALGPPKTRAVVVVSNSGEMGVDNRAIRALVRRWNAHGAAIEHRVLRGMPPSHDIIEPEHAVALADRVYPALLDAIDPTRRAGGSPALEQPSSIKP
jgi:pimeloyl-ACP methyl ester carboxylesterase